MNGTKVFLRSMAACAALLFGVVHGTAMAQDAVLETEETNYQIVYLVDPEAVDANSLAAPAALETALNATVATSWEGVEELQASATIDALIIHHSALTSVDAEWVRDAYIMGVVIGGIDVPIEDIVKLTGDRRPGENFGEPYETTFYIVVSQLTLGSPADVARVRGAQQGTTGDRIAEGVSGYTLSGYGVSNDRLVTNQNLETFTLSVTNHLESIDAMHHEFAKSTGAK